MRTPLPVDDLPVGCGISSAEFAALTCFCNASDNGPDDERRARLLGFGNGVKVAPGAIIRIGDNEIGENSFIGLYAYLNGDVRIGRNVLIGPHCSLPAGNHRFDPATQAFTRRDLARRSPSATAPSSAAAAPSPTESRSAGATSSAPTP